ncbi:MAG: sortase domain-bontaining protein [Eggerthellaceae bacterium]
MRHSGRVRRDPGAMALVVLLAVLLAGAAAGSAISPGNGSRRPMRCARSSASRCRRWSAPTTRLRTSRRRILSTLRRCAGRAPTPTRGSTCRTRTSTFPCSSGRETTSSTSIMTATASRPSKARCFQMANATDFSDPVTVLYGHNIVNDAMFATLHAYEDPAFFADNPELYVYLPDRILAYEVVAAYEYDDRHILNSFDFSDPAVRTGYFASVLAPDDPKANVRDGAQLDADDRIVQLSTCRSALTSDPVRYIVTAVLVGEKPAA